MYALLEKIAYLPGYINFIFLGDSYLRFPLCSQPEGKFDFFLTAIYSGVR